MLLIFTPKCSYNPHFATYRPHARMFLPIPYRSLVRQSEMKKLLNFCALTLFFQDRIDNQRIVKAMISNSPPLVKHHSEIPRNSRILQIKNELKGFPLLSRNRTMVEKKMSIQAETLSDSLSTDGHSLENQELSVVPTFEHIEIFAEKYEITEKLGEGSNGVVHRCIKRRSGQQFAVKSFMFDDQQLPDLKSNFLLIKNLKHRNLIQYEALYIDLKKHACWLVMEYFEAKPLSFTIIESQVQLRQVALQIFETIHYLHQRAIVHRDIKLENVLYDPKAAKLKLIDFGICRKHRRRGAKFDMLTITGTLYYRAPEMFTGGGYNEKVDIWAAGVLLYKIVTGRTPFESEYHSQTINNIISSEIKYLPGFEKYSSQLKSFIGKIFTKNPQERPTAIECLRDSWLCHSSIPFIQQHRSSFDMQDEQGLKSPIGENLVQVKSYVRQINGAEFHCIDSDDEGQKRSLKRQHHRSMMIELNGFTL